MANNHALFSSLYENPLAAGALPAEAQLHAACHGRLVDYLLRDGLSNESGAALEAVESLPHVPPRAHLELAPVSSLPTIPPRALELAPVASLPTIPPRALELAPVSSIPSLPPRA